jgi:[NiFe] hydrogenase diaphorase moiety large subunit
MDTETLFQEIRQHFKHHYAQDKLLLLQILQLAYRKGMDFSAAFFDSLAEKLSMPAAEIEGIANFYNFLDAPCGTRYDIRISDNIIDQFQNNRTLYQDILDKYAENTAVNVSLTSCTGMGDQGPAILVNGLAIANVNTEVLKQIFACIDQNLPVNSWPSELFSITDNIQLRDMLLNEVSGNGTAISKLVSNEADKALSMIENAGLRGRGGAGFSTARKWLFCQQARATEKHVICNADEGEPGTFKDRVLLNSYADQVVEGMTLCAGITGARNGYLYLRGEYYYLLPKLNQVLQQRRAKNLLGKNIMGKTGFDFDIDIHLGAGAYICGEESALIESLEGKRGIPRNRPPFPVTHGYLNQPTVVNNVETFMAAAGIVEHGAEWFRQTGTDKSSGSKLISISGDCDKPGIYEYPFGTSIQQILSDCGAHETQAVQVAGAAGHLLSPAEFDQTISFEDFSTAGSFMVFNQSRDLFEIVKNFTAFFKHESCGFCTPCRVGTSLQDDLAIKLANGNASRFDLDEIQSIADLMHTSSHCGLGVTASTALLDLIEKFPELINRRLSKQSFEPAFDLDAALEESRQLTGRNDTQSHIGGYHD